MCVEVHGGAGALAPRTEPESFLEGRYRLACQAVIAAPGVVIDFSPLRRVPKILTQTRRRSTVFRLQSRAKFIFHAISVVWRALQAYRSAAGADPTGLAKGAGFADALIVFKALRIAREAVDTLHGAFTFDKAMQRLPHTKSL